MQKPHTPTTDDLIEILADLGFDTSSDLFSEGYTWIAERTYAYRWEAGDMLTWINLGDGEVLVTYGTHKMLIHGEARFPLNAWGLETLKKALA